MLSGIISKTSTTTATTQTRTTRYEDPTKPRTKTSCFYSVGICWLVFFYTFTLLHFFTFSLLHSYTFTLLHFYILHFYTLHSYTFTLVHSYTFTLLPIYTFTHAGVQNCRDPGSNRGLQIFTLTLSQLNYRGF